MKQYEDRNMVIKRDKYLNDLIIRMHNGLIKVITGVRRSGKSYLLNNIFYNYLVSNGVSEDHIIKFAFDSADDLELIGEDYIDLDKNNQKVDPKKFMDYVKKQIVDSGEYYLLLDEVQNLGGFESVLNGYLRKANIDVYVTGSNSKFLSHDVITEFEGRGDEIHVLPLSFSEFLPTFNGTKEEAYENYSIFGGLPLVATMKTDEQKSKYLSDQIEKVYLKDIIKRNNIKTVSNIGELFNFLASDITCAISINKLKNTFKSKTQISMSRETVDNYINYFVDSFLISKAFKYDVKGKHYIDAQYKIYFEDIGLRNAKLGFRQVEPSHIMENIIYNELRYRGYNVDVGIVETTENVDGKQVRKQYEIDHIATKGSSRYYIQSAYDISSEGKWKQETNSYNNLKKDSFKKIILTKDPVVSRYNEDGYLVMGLLDFLLDINSLDR